MTKYITLSLLTGSLLFGLSLGTAPAASFQGKLGLQLYSLREDFAKDVPGSLARVRQFGFRNVELAGTYQLEPKVFRKMLKDMKKGLATGDLSGHTDVRNDVALGTGQMDMPAILKAAKAAKVKWYFIEDESPSVHDQLPVSLKYLETVKF